MALVNLARTGLKDLTIDDIEDREKLEKLYIGRNFIETCSLVFDFVNLVELDFGINGLTHFPNIAAATQLKRLYLNNNSIPDIDVDQLSHLHQLQVLDLRRNKLTALELPDSMATLTFFSISQNDVEEIGYIPDLPVLEKLCLFGNLHLSRQKVVTLLQKTPAIQALHVGGTGISDMPYASAEQEKDIIELVPNIRQLDGRCL